MKTEQAEFGMRLRQALQHARLPESATELAGLVPKYGADAVTDAAVHRWIHGQSIPRLKNLKALARLLNVSLEWLQAGDQVDARRVAEPKRPWAAGALDQHAIDAFLTLPPAQRKLVRELIAALAKTA